MTLNQLIEHLQYLRETKYSGNTKIYTPSGFGYWGNEYTNNMPIPLAKPLIQEHSLGWALDADENFEEEDLKDININEIILLIG